MTSVPNPTGSASGGEESPFTVDGTVPGHPAEFKPDNKGTTSSGGNEVVPVRDAGPGAVPGLNGGQSTVNTPGAGREPVLRYVIPAPARWFFQPHPTGPDTGDALPPAIRTEQGIGWLADLSGYPDGLREACFHALDKPKRRIFLDAQQAQQRVKDDPTGARITEDDFLSFGDMVKQVEDAPPRSWLVRNLIKHGSYGVYGAPSKAAKSMACNDLMVCIAHEGRDLKWLDRFRVETHGPVVALLGEGTVEDFVYRVKGIAESKGLTDDEIRALNIVALPRAPQLSDAEHLEVIERVVKRTGAVFVLLDPFYLAAGADADAANLNKMGALLHPIQRLAQRHGATLLVVAHFNKTGQGGGARRYSGVGLEQWGRFLIAQELLKRVKDDDTGQTELFSNVEVDGDGASVGDFGLHMTVRPKDPERRAEELVYAVECAAPFTNADLPSTRGGSSTAGRTDGLTGQAAMVYDVLREDMPAGKWHPAAAIYDRMRARYGERTGKGGIPSSHREAGRKLGELAKDRPDLGIAIQEGQSRNDPALYQLTGPRNGAEGGVGNT